MTTISTELVAQLQAMPGASFDLIVKTQGEATPYLAWLAAQDIRVTRQFRLTPGVAVTCSGAAAQQLAAQDWVVSVELDQPVSAF